MHVLTTQDELLEWTRTRDRVRVHTSTPAALDSVELDIVRMVSDTCTYAPEDSAALFEDMVSYIAWSSNEVASPSTEVAGLRNHGARIVNRSFPLTAICLPSNATVPLAGIFVHEAERLGAPVILSPTAGQEEIVLTIARTLNASSNVAVWMGRSRDLVSWSLADRLVEQIYFLGSSAIYPQLAMECAQAGIQLRFEGQGDGLAYVGETADLAFASNALVEAKRFCEGRMCSSPSGVLVHNSIAPDFVRAFEQASELAQLRKPLGESVADPAWRASLHAALGSSWADVRSPTLIPRPQNQPGESFSPVSWWSPVSSIDELRYELRRTPYRLQVSYFGSDPEEARVVTDARFARVCLNMNPADQDPVLPWGNYGLSGDSPLVTFREKLQFAQLVEGAV